MKYYRYIAYPAQVTEPRLRGLRRRGRVLERALLDAAWDELVAVGYANLTIDGVAARARTSKPVLYRRWPSRPLLMLAALRQRAPMLSGPVPDKGSLRADVLALLERMSTRLEEAGQEVLVGLLADLFRDPEALGTLRSEIAIVSAEVMRVILERASKRGEVDARRIPPRVATLPVDLMRHELLVTRAAVPVSVLCEIVDEVFLPLCRRNSSVSDSDTCPASPNTRDAAG